MFDFIIPVAIVLSIATASAIANKRFSKNVFLTSIAVGMAVMIWIPLLPSFMIVVSILCIVGMIFSDSGSDSV